MSTGRPLTSPWASKPVKNVRCAISPFRAPMQRDDIEADLGFARPAIPAAVLSHKGGVLVARRLQMPQKMNSERRGVSNEFVDGLARLAGMFLGTTSEIGIRDVGAVKIWPAIKPALDDQIDLIGRHIIAEVISAIIHPVERARPGPPIKPHRVTQAAGEDLRALTRLEPDYGRSPGMLLDTRVYSSSQRWHRTSRRDPF